MPDKPLSDKPSDSTSPVVPPADPTGDDCPLNATVGTKPNRAADSRRRRESRMTYLAALVYGGTSLAIALVFLAVTTFTGSYTAVARYGGAVWVFILTMIVLMPLVIPWMKKQCGL